MLTRVSAIPLFLFVAATAPAQVFQLTGYDDLTTPLGPPVSGILDARWAALTYNEEPGEATLIFVNTTLEPPPPTNADLASVAEGIVVVYPFLAPPEAWTTGDPSALPSGVTLAAATATDLVIPPLRVRDHISKFLQAGGPGGTSAFGTYNPPPGTVASVQWSSTSATLQGLAPDEQRPWIDLGAPGWATASANIPVFEVANLGCASVQQAAHNLVEANTPWLDVDDLQVGLLNDLLREDYGFLIHVQAAHVKSEPGANPVVRFSQPRVMRRASLKSFEPSPLPPMRWVPWIVGEEQRMYLGGRGEHLTIQFTELVGNLTALIPTSSGTVAVSQQPWPVEVPNPMNIACFSYPPNAVTGLVYFTGTNLLPVGHNLGAAMVWAYDPPNL